MTQILDVYEELSLPVVRKIDILEVGSGHEIQNGRDAWGEPVLIQRECREGQMSVRCVTKRQISSEVVLAQKYFLQIPAPP